MNNPGVVIKPPEVSGTLSGRTCETDGRKVHVQQSSDRQTPPVGILLNLLKSGILFQFKKTQK